MVVVVDVKMELHKMKTFVSVMVQHKIVAVVTANIKW